MTDQRNTRIPQFFLTPGGPCPYLPGRTERKVFARLGGNLAQPLSEALTHSGFRRSQSIAYRPACEGCSACVSVRIKASQFESSRSIGLGELFDTNQVVLANRAGSIEKEEHHSLWFFASGG